MNTHYRLWPCPVGCTLDFGEAKYLIDHIYSTHSRVHDPGQLQGLLEGCALPNRKAFALECPLCKTATMSPELWFKHVGHHLEELACYTLPAKVYGDEDDQDDLDVASIASEASEVGYNISSQQEPEEAIVSNEDPDSTERNVTDNDPAPLQTFTKNIKYETRILPRENGKDGGYRNRSQVELEMDALLDDEPRDSDSENDRIRHRHEQAQPRQEVQPLNADLADVRSTLMDASNAPSSAHSPAPASASRTSRETEQRPRGILKKPTQSFPDNVDFVRESVAPPRENVPVRASLSEVLKY